MSSFRRPVLWDLRGPRVAAPPLHSLSPRSKLTGVGARPHYHHKKDNRTKHSRFCLRSEPERFRTNTTSCAQSKITLMLVAERGGRTVPPTPVLHPRTVLHSIPLSHSALARLEGGFASDIPSQQEPMRLLRPSNCTHRNSQCCLDTLQRTKDLSLGRCDVCRRARANTTPQLRGILLIAMQCVVCYRASARWSLETSKGSLMSACR